MTWLLRRLTVVLTAVTVMAGAAAGGRAYLWCDSMSEARSHCCCPEPEPSFDLDAPLQGAMLSQPCCEDRVMGELPAAQTAAAHVELALAPSYVVQGTRIRPEPAGTSHAAAPFPRIERTRAGPRQRLHQAYSVYLI